MSLRLDGCRDCETGFPDLNRRSFLKTAGAVAVAASVLPRWASAETTANSSPPESLVKKLYDSLSEQQRKTVAFKWDHVDPDRGLLRTHVANNWNITEPAVGSRFYTKDQQEMIRAVYEGVFNPDWVTRIDKQQKDDAGGYGKSQSIAIFGQPGEGLFELVMTSRHMTIRCDGNTTEHVAFGGPIFHGHAASGGNEKPDHPGNVFWPQALEANKIFEMLDGKQRKLALQSKSPTEQEVGFRGPLGEFPGAPVTELSSDQKEQLQKTLRTMLDPYRDVDRSEAMECLKTQGGLDKCALAFYQDNDIGRDGVWDNWRLEGPSFVWYFRGSPHVHLWINVASDPSVETNS